MKRLLLLCLLALPAHGSVFTDDLQRCIVKAIKPLDQSIINVWMFSAMALHPDLVPYASVTTEVRDKVCKDMAAIYHRVSEVDCKAEWEASRKADGQLVMQVYFMTVGQMAGQNVFLHPDVLAGQKAFATAMTQKVKT